MSASASKSADTSKADQPTPSETEKPSQQSQLGALEEDDEFEEFPAQGTFPLLALYNFYLMNLPEYCISCRLG